MDMASEHLTAQCDRTAAEHRREKR
jgi:hypothetical protein